MSVCLQGALQAFIDYIVRCKTVMLEDLASEFGLRVQVKSKAQLALHIIAATCASHSSDLVCAVGCLRPLRMHAAELPRDLLLVPP